MGRAASRGRLKVFLGAAPGVGKTFAMLDEARERAAQGVDVVVAYVEDHGRERTAARAEGLEIVPRASVSYRGGTFPELDLQAVLDRAPQLAIVDELAHSIAATGRAGAGAEHTKRWQDVETLLDAGIDVLSTVNVQHLESLNDVVQAITGTRQRETLPDRVLRDADEIELVDLSPDQLRIRLSRGEVYPSDRVDAALSNYFRVGNLTALRELALLWLADRVEAGLAEYRSQQHIDSTWPARERVVVAVTGGSESETLIRRGMRIVGSTAGRELLAVHVVQDDGLTAGDPTALATQRALVESLGGTWHTVVGDDVAQALLDFARSVNASQLVLGVSRHGPWSRLFGPGVSTRVINGSGDIDVHMVTHQAAAAQRSVRRQRRPSVISPLRRTLGWIAAVVAPAVATASSLAFGAGAETLGIELLAHLTIVVLVALLGGLWPAVTAALLGVALVNWFFTEPVGTLRIASPQVVFTLVLFLTVAAAVAWVVDLAARRSRDALAAANRASLLSELASGVIRDGMSIPALLAQLAETFGQESVTLLRRTDVDTGRRQWSVLDSAGPAVTAPHDAETVITADDGLALALRGRPVSAADRSILDAYAGRIAAVRGQQDLDEARRTGAELAAGNAMRTALLAAVSHDLRTPLAAIKASVSSLRLADVQLTPAERQELEQTIEEAADRLDALIANLLDMSRVQTGSLVAGGELVDPGDVVAAALEAVGRDADRVTVVIPEDAPLALGDFGLTERVLANLLENALHYAGAGPIELTVSSVEQRLEFRVVDHGPGVADADKTRMFQPFQRLGDSSDRGVGLGLAVAQGFASAMGGTLTAEDTPGGGLTQVLAVPLAPANLPTTLEEAVDA